ncbi:helix-turn-helix transcriptional regulator [Aestuariivivens sediminis]|uniref:helix-turn-helix transcriptional regulator n=1 Tax=Aestuariivivens sediminis TaxID=2913557 RepID=UPI001F58B718|nr:helix-turn-helix transcriptional regulator [Aestuariivivens sediminis]
MINSEAFANRLQKVIEYYNESASSFAEKIGVQRSSISHILSGRNKPSLEFVLKIISYYPDIELYWLLNGKGEFPAISKTTSTAPQISDNYEHSPKESEFKRIDQGHKTIERIVIFYTDGTFKNFQNGSNS